jgi:uncharacterized protein YwqG
MKTEFERLVEKYNLLRFKRDIEESLLRCVGFDINESEVIAEKSKIGGNPVLPLDFVWPHNDGRPLDHLLQIDLADACAFDETRVLPTHGTLTFFYDLEKQPWGFDPADADGFKVVFVESEEITTEHDAPVSEFCLPHRPIVFRNALSVPTIGSRSYNRLEERITFTDEEFDRYNEFSLELNATGSNYKKQYWGGHHQMLGHSQNVQGDMQLEAQLVTNGIYCGDSSGYNDPRTQLLEQGAEDWVLLLQLDSDETSDLMWGDVGMLYFWIKRQDLTDCRFENVWVALQCS